MVFMAMENTIKMQSDNPMLLLLLLLLITSLKSKHFRIPLIIDIIDYCNSWMRFNLHSSWIVIEDFCCSVSGLTHFSYLLLTPIECTIHCYIIHAIYPYLRMDISVISHINEHKLIRHSMEFNKYHYQISIYLSYLPEQFENTNF